MTKEKKITIELSEELAELLSFSLADILCFLAGIKAGKSEDDNRFNILLEKHYLLRDLNDNIRKQLK